MRARRGAGAAALALAAVLAAMVTPHQRAQADDANAECANNDDVTLVVDFQDLGGGVNVRCAPQPVDSGRAVFTRTNTAMDDFNGFVCRIAGKPTEGPCSRYPPASAYWVYWVAARGGSWCTSNIGIDQRTPPPGTIEGWSFAKNKKRGQLPPPRYPVPAPIPDTEPHPLNPDDCDATTSPSTTTSTPASTATTSASGEFSNPTTPPTGSGRRVTPTTAAAADAAAATSTPASALPGIAPTTSTSRVPFGDVDLTVRDSGGDGSPFGVIVSAGAIVAVGAAGWFARRRRF